MFLFKKIVGLFLLPIPLCILISFLGLLLILLTKKQRAGKIMVVVGISILTLTSLDPISSTLLAPLEHQYNAYLSKTSMEDEIIENQCPVKYVVVLSGYGLIEGVRIYRKNPGSKLILSGGSASGSYPAAKHMAEIVQVIGIDEDDIMIESESRDTKDQAHFIKLIVDNDPFILVTSAFHMPRSMALFKKLGMEPSPAPAVYLTGKKKGLNLSSFFPSTSALRKSELAFHEYLGILWAKLRGQI